MKAAEFKEAIRDALEVLGSEVAVGRVIGVSTPSVGRWAIGENTPHPLLRAAIVAALCDAIRVKAEEDARRLELRCCNGSEDYVEADTLDGDRVVLTCFEGAHEACVNLNRASVEKLHAWLGAWLERDNG